MKEQLINLKKKMQVYIQKYRELKSDINFFDELIKHQLEQKVMETSHLREKNRACLALINGSVYESGRELYLSNLDYINEFILIKYNSPEKILKEGFINNFVRSYERKVESLSPEEKQVIRYDISYLLFLDKYGLTDLIEKELELEATKNSISEITNPFINATKEKLNSTKKAITSKATPCVEKAKLGVNKGVKVLSKVLKSVEEKT